MPIRIAIVEDQPAARRDLVRLFRGADAVQVVGACASAEEAIRTLQHADLDVILVDLVLPGGNGIELVRTLKRRRPTLIALMLTVYDDPRRVFASIAAGADGYLLKSTPRAELVARVRESVDTGVALSPTIARKVVQHFRRQAAELGRMELLSGRELEVLREVAKGSTYKEVGTTLGITTETVRVHIRNAKAKLEVSTRGQAVARYLGFDGG